MKIIDNRHLDYTDMVHTGDLVITENDNKYIFVLEDDNELPFHQVDFETFEVVDSYPDAGFKILKVGSRLEEGGRIKEIIKNKNLVLDIRN